MRGTIESYDGMAVVKTVDPQAGVVELRIAPGCEGLIQKILNHLSRRENLEMTAINTPLTDPGLDEIHHTLPLVKRDREGEP